MKSRKDVQALLEILPNNQADYQTLFNAIEGFSNSTTGASAWSMMSVPSIIYNFRPIISLLLKYRNGLEIDTKTLLTDAINHGLLEEIATNDQYRTKISNLLTAFADNTVAKQRFLDMPMPEQKDEFLEGAINSIEKSQGVLSKAILPSMGYINMILELSQRQPAEFLQLFQALNKGSELKTYLLSLTEFLYAENANPKSTAIPIMKADMLQKLVGAITKPEVAIALTKVANKDLLTDLFAGDKLGPEVRAYGPLLINLAQNSPQQFQDLFQALTKQKEFKPFLSSLMISIEAAPQDVVAKANMLETLTQTITKPEVVVALREVATSRLLTDLFEGDKLSPEVRAYGPLVIHLAEKNQEEFQELFYTLAKTDEFRIYLSDLMRFINPVKQESESQEKAINRTFNQSMIALIDAITDEAIIKSIPLITPQLVRDILAVLDTPKQIEPDDLQQSVKPERGIKKRLSRKISQQEGEECKEDIAAVTEAISNAVIADMGQAKTESPIMQKLIERVRGLARNPEHLQAIVSSIKNNEDELSETLQAFIDSDQGKALKRFGVDGSEIIQGILPEVLNNKTLLAVAKYAENPNIISQVVVISRLKVLSFAFQHLAHVLNPFSKPRPPSPVNTVITGSGKIDVETSSRSAFYNALDSARDIFRSVRTIDQGSESPNRSESPKGSKLSWISKISGMRGSGISK